MWGRFVFKILVEIFSVLRKFQYFSVVGVIFRIEYEVSKTENTDPPNSHGALTRSPARQSLALKALAGGLIGIAARNSGGQGGR